MALPLIMKPSLNFDSREFGVPVDILLLHYTGMKDAEVALARLVDQDAKVSAHYVIDESGEIYKLVSERKRAWHAGVATWRGNININSRSIGIELVNPGHEFGYRKFPIQQMDTLIKISKEILKRHYIPARNVVGHSDVAPSRKLDPGELFDWKILAEEGIGIWPDSFKHKWMKTNNHKKNLSEIGYNTSDLKSAISAFQRHFRSSKITGEMDIDTESKIAGVLSKIR